MFTTCLCCLVLAQTGRSGRASVNPPNPAGVELVSASLLEPLDGSERIQVNAFIRSLAA